MTRNKWRSLCRNSALPLFIITFIAVAGCATPARPPTAALDPVPLPVYHAGTTFVYTNGSWETVEDASPDRVTWRNHRGYRSSGSSDFTYRRATWETRTRSGTRQIKARRDWRGDPAPASLWPLRPGRIARYIEVGRWRDAEGKLAIYEAHWRAEVVGRQRIQVTAGEFHTWKIVARRYSPGDAFRKSRLREIRTWYYAPEVGHYVKLERDYRGRRPNRTIELLAVQPSLNDLNAAARETLKANFQKALENHQSGAALTWPFGDGAATVATKPMATYRLDSGTYCRQYTQKVKRSGQEKAFFGLACRTEEGRWQIPRK
jgi:surface antigen